MCVTVFASFTYFTYLLTPDAFRRRLRRRMGTGTAPSPGGVTHWAAV